MLDAGPSSAEPVMSCHGAAQGRVGGPLTWMATWASHRLCLGLYLPQPSLSLQQVTFLDAAVSPSQQPFALLVKQDPVFPWRKSAPPPQPPFSGFMLQAGPCPQPWGSTGTPGLSQWAQCMPQNTALKSWMAQPS